MSNLETEEPSAKRVQKNAYRVPKKLFWPVTLTFAAIFIVLLVLTIYFGVNRKIQDDTETGSRTTETPTVSLPATTTSSPLRPVERIPHHWRPLLYRLTITPDLTDETFTGDEHLYVN